MNLAHLLALGCVIFVKCMSLLDGFAFDPFSFQQDHLTVPETRIGWRASDGERTIKVHASVNSRGPLNFTLTGGHVHESQLVEELLDTPKSLPAVTADKKFFYRIRDWQRIATLYDKIARSILASDNLVGALRGSSCESRS